MTKNQQASIQNPVARNFCLRGAMSRKWNVCLITVQSIPHLINSALLLVMPLMISGSCIQRSNNAQPPEKAVISSVVEKMTEIMVHDVTNPPLAARFFAYACISGYEIVAQHDSLYASMHGRLNNFPVIREAATTGYDYRVSVILAMIITAKALQPSGSMLEAFEIDFLHTCRENGLSQYTIRQSRLYALEVSEQIIGYAQSDGYHEISNYPRYTPLKGDSTWYPTPPGYIAAVEPYFNTVRTLALDAASQFKPSNPTIFCTKEDSDFYKMLVEVYETGKNLSEEQTIIASFWDCNPFALQRKGHLMVGLKKISPGAHWMGIAGIACKNDTVDFHQTMKIQTVVAIALMDAFISCWDEKYRSNRVRPETAIRKYIDSQWEPLLQTPPFPEYTSGHSTISAAAAYILTYYFGDHFAFTDTIEIPYGLPERHFKSFMEAAEEAAISRLYGGIHYRDANENGLIQGLKVGKQVIKRMIKQNNNKSSYNLIRAGDRKNSQYEF